MIYLRITLVIAFLCAHNPVFAGMPSLLSHSHSVSLRQGKIVFVSGRDRKTLNDDNFEIYVMRPDGSGQTRLTHNSHSDAAPVFSPNGQKIAFMSFRDENAEIYIMNADGSDQMRLTNNSAWDGAPAFNPEGNRIVFQTNRSGLFTLYTMKVDGTDQRSLLKDVAAKDPLYSPTGDKIIYWSVSDPNRNPRNYIYSVNSDGSNITRLHQGRNPAFSPDGRGIAFENNGEIYLIDSDGKNEKRLTNDKAFDGEPCFSPDAKEIVFTSTTQSRTARAIFSEQLFEGEVKQDLFVMNVDGTNIRRITNSPHTNAEPMWMKDEIEIDHGKIVFGSDRDSPVVVNDPDGIRRNNEIYIMNVDGTKVSRLSPLWADDGGAVFSPDGSQIAFTATTGTYTLCALFPDKLFRSEVKRDIFVMNADGTGIRRLTNSPHSNVGPSWAVTPGQKFTPVPLATVPPQMEKPVSQAASDDPFVPLPASASVATPIAGQLIYGVNHHNTPPFPSFLVIRDFAQAQTEIKPQVKTDVATYRIKGLEGLAQDSVFEPQLAPDSRYVLVKLGLPSPPPGGHFKLHVWDRQTNELKQIAKRELFYRQVWWSPDSNYVAYIAGGDGEGNVGPESGEPLQLLVCNWRTGEEKLVVKNDTVRFNVSWAPPHTLI